MKWQTLFIMLLLVAPVAFADTIYAQAGKPTKLYADISTGQDWYGSANQVNVSVYAPNQTLIINNKQMTQLATGRYYYNFTFNATGEYYVNVAYFNTTSTIAVASNLLEVQRGPGTMELAVIVGLLAFTTFLAYFGHKFWKEGTEKKSEYTWLFGLLFYFSATIIFTIMLFVIMKITESESYYGVIKVLFMTLLVISGAVGALGFLAVGLFIIFLTIAPMFSKEK